MVASSPARRPEEILKLHGTASSGPVPLSIWTSVRVAPLSCASAGDAAKEAANKIAIDIKIARNGPSTQKRSQLLLTVVARFPVGKSPDHPSPRKVREAA